VSAIGAHHVKASKPGSETQRMHGFSPAGNTDLTDKHINENTHDSVPSPIWNMFVTVPLLQDTSGRRNRKRG
jgi:hypothetical protein